MTEQEKEKKCAELVGKSKEVIRETCRQIKRGNPRDIQEVQPP